MYDSAPMGSLATGLGGVTVTVPWLGIDALWVGVAAFTLTSAVLALRRAAPRRPARRPARRWRPTRPWRS